MSTKVYGEALYDYDVIERIEELENATIIYQLFKGIESGTSGTITTSTNSTILMDRYLDGADALVVQVDSNNRPIDSPVYTNEGLVVTTTFNAAGEYSFSGTPSSYPVAVVYQIIISTKYWNEISLFSIVTKFRVLNVSENHNILLNLDYTHSGHTGFEPTISKGNITESTSSVLTITGGTGAVIGSGASIEVKQSGISQNGYLTSSDWNNFNNKISFSEELAQDAVGTILTDTNTIDLSYNDVNGSISADVRYQMSITSDSSGVKLQGDESSPSSSYYYGTNSGGTKGFYVLPSGSITGGIIMYGGSSAPSGYLMCDGTAVSRTTYSTLFGIIGTTFGTGDGSTTFNVPDLRQRFPLGKATSGTGSTLGATGGTIDHTHDSHTSAQVGILGLLSPGLTGPTTHSSVNPPFQVVNYIIKT